MKFVATILLSSFISVLIVDCHNFHDEPGGQNPLDEAQQTSETVDGHHNPDSVGEDEDKPWKETPLTVTEIKEPHKQKGEGQSGLRGKIKGGSKCKVTIGCSLLGGSCVGKANVCNGRVADFGCKGNGCKCCIPRGVIEKSIANMTIQLQAVQEKLIQLESNNVNLAHNLTVANSKLDSKLESNNVNIANNLTVAISQLDSKLESNNVNLSNNLTVAISQLDSKLESNNVNLANNLTVSISQLDSKLESNNVNLANNLTVANSQLDSKLESNNLNLANNLTVAISQLDSKLESNNVNIANNLTVAISQLDSKLESNNVNLSNNLTVANSQLDSKLQLIHTNLTALDSKMEYIKQNLDERPCSDNFTRKCPGGFFKIGSQCYHLYTDRSRNWNDSKSKCETEGLVMAGKPDDAITLRKYLVDNFGDKWVWLGARGDGTVYRWVYTNGHISNTDALWYPGRLGSQYTTSYCLELLAYKSWYNDKPAHPFDPAACSSTSRYTLCENPKE